MAEALSDKAKVLGSIFMGLTPSGEMTIGGKYSESKLNPYWDDAITELVDSGYCTATEFPHNPGRFTYKGTGKFKFKVPLEMIEQHNETIAVKNNE